MPTNNQTKADMQEALDSIEEVLDGAYQPESSREELVSAISQALDILQENGDEDVGDEDDDDSD